jgi:hypothetical protein
MVPRARSRKSGRGWARRDSVFHETPPLSLVRGATLLLLWMGAMDDSSKSSGVFLRAGHTARWNPISSTATAMIGMGIITQHDRPKTTDDVCSSKNGRRRPSSGPVGHPDYRGKCRLPAFVKSKIYIRTRPMITTILAGQTPFDFPWQASTDDLYVRGSMCSDERTTIRNGFESIIIPARRRNHADRPRRNERTNRPPRPLHHVLWSDRRVIYFD